MSVRLGLVLVPLFASATAFAQAPGEVSSDSDPYTESEPSYAQPPPYAGPSATPPVQPVQPVAADPCGGRSGVMAHRFAVGINLGGLGVSPADQDDATETNFRTAELSLRFRATRHLELELLLSGGRQVLEDDTDGDLAMGGATLAARYRFRPDRAWNWWLMGGLGATVIENHNSSEEQRDAASRPHVAFGIGLEHRWNRFALHADLRMMALGPRKDSEDMTFDDAPSNGTTRGINDVVRAEDLSAGQFTLGASFYF